MNRKIDFARPNIFCLVLKYATNPWKIVVFDPPNKLKSDYNNLLINSTIPKKNSVISFPYQDQLFEIKYNIPIQPSSGKITVFQMGEKGSSPIKKQSYSANTYCEVKDEFTLSCDLFLTTFNRPNTSYMIEILNGCVESSKKEQLVGINANVWGSKLKINQLILMERFFNQQKLHFVYQNMEPIYLIIIQMKK